MSATELGAGNWEQCEAGHPGMPHVAHYFHQLVVNLTGNLQRAKIALEQCSDIRMLQTLSDAVDYAVAKVTTEVSHEHPLSEREGCDDARCVKAAARLVKGRSRPWTQAKPPSREEA